MLPVPEKQSLIVQAAVVLRRGIAQGRWRVALPAERALASELGISRPTLRRALGMLEREGHLEASVRGQCRRIRKKGGGRRGGAMAGTKAVVLLSETPPYRMGFRELCLLEELRHAMGRHDFELDARVYPNVAPSRMDAALTALTRARPGCIWLLTRSPRIVQKWFAGSGLPVLVRGSCGAGLELPSVGTDYRAVCRHAAGVFLGRGYRRLVLLRHPGSIAGDLAGEAGFREGVARSGADGVDVRIVKAAPEREAICHCLRETLQSVPTPLAILCLDARHALTVLGEAHRMSLEIPGELSLISREDDPVLPWVVPTITHYRHDPLKLTRKVTRLILQLAGQGVLPPRFHPVIPEYQPGETVGRVA